MAKVTMKEARRRPVEKALADETFRKKLIENPKACIKEELGISVPEQVEVTVLEETPSKVFLVLPARKKAVMSEENLKKVAAGNSGCGCNCVSNCDPWVCSTCSA